MLDDLASLSRLGRAHRPPERVTLQELAEEAASMVAGRIDQRGVDVRIHDGDITLTGDRARLAAIWQNLVDNAVKFMGDQAHPRIDIGARRDGDEIIFHVRDNGVGIDSRHHDTVYDLYTKLDPGSEGTGMGLALVKRIVTQCQGNIWLESAGAGQGVCFFFTLPASCAPAAAALDHPCSCV